MRFALLLLAALVLLSPCAEAASRSSSKPLLASPQASLRFVSLRKWAAQKGFTYKHNALKKEGLLSSKWSTLFFTRNDRRCSINGITLWLSDPIAEGKDTLFISERDLNTHLLPVLFPVKITNGKKVQTIAISAGHGGKDPGYIIRNEYEKKYTLLFARELQQLLVRAGFKVVMTREKDVYVDPQEQAAIAARAKADLFVNLHFNAHPNVDAKGVEVFCLATKGVRSTNGGRIAEGSIGNKNDSLNIFLAYQLQKALVRDMGLLDRGVRHAQFIVLRYARMPCVLVEGGFMSNPSDARKIFDVKNRRKMAQSITDGILWYKKAVER